MVTYGSAPADADRLRALAGPAVDSGADVRAGTGDGISS